MVTRCSPRCHGSGNHKFILNNSYGEHNFVNIIVVTKVSYAAKVAGKLFSDFRRNMTISSIHTLKITEFPIELRTADGIFIEISY